MHEKIVPAREAGVKGGPYSPPDVRDGEVATYVLPEPSPRQRKAAQVIGRRMGGRRS